MTSFVLQSFSEKDMDVTNEVLKAAYRIQYSRKDNLRKYLVVKPSLALVAREGHEIVGFGGALDYGPFAYIGLMAAHPKVQRRGVGRMILEQILVWLAERRCPTILLDASPPGVHLYEKHEFVHAGKTHVVQLAGSKQFGQLASGSIRPLDRKEDFDSLISFDEPFFGADRRSLLNAYFEDDPKRFLISKDGGGRINGFLVAQTRVLGPWVASNPRVAEELLSKALQFSFSDGPTVFVSNSNTGCLEVLGRYGFGIQRSLSHMYRGKQIQRARSTTIYGQATLGFG